ncbi:TonB-dependent receptor [uncultured Polaribacter sp.]|uniref:SusC/RagA family TonB-linked outer membrane protein n=1 Tax=uncultured Polaribacter sp. TaxID=174711 RepID=UPI0026018C93|nr:TonB-dependent receptor [uncultured Polaribacter sp.]
MKQILKKRNPSLGILLMLFLLFSGFTNFNIQAQEKISGVVKDLEGYVLPGVSILQKGTTRGTSTDFDGNYSIELTLGQKTLVFSYLGYKRLEVPVNGKTIIDVTLEVESESLDEIVIVGYGTQKKESVVGAITQVKGVDLMDRAAGITNVEEALQGNLPGVTAIQGSGTPGESNMKIFIRGLSSWNGDGGPLILVDGVKRQMSDIDMNDIENLSVLKDASATAVFGVEGANGVILITTKRGQTGKAQLSLNVNSTIKTVSQLPEKLDSYDAIMQANSSILRELSLTPGSWGDYVPMAIIDKYRNPSSVDERYIYPNVNWEDEILKDFAQDLRVNLSVRGGNKTAKYFGSLAYQSVNDIFDGAKFNDGRGSAGAYKYERFNYRSNIDFDITSTTELSVNLSGYLGIRENPSSLATVTNGIYQIAPNLFTPVYPDGIFGQSINPAFIFTNPAVSLSNTGYDTFRNYQVNTDIILKQKLDFIAEGLSFKGRFSLDNNMRTEQSVNDGGVLYRVFVDGVPGPGSDNPVGVNDFDYVRDPWGIGAAEVDDVSGRTGRARQMVYDVSLNYDKTIAEKHNLTALFLIRRQETATGSQFPRFREDWVGRVTYNYDNRYFIDVNGAYNGSEKFGPGYRFDLFPSIALGWTPTNESFLKNSDWLSKLKFRGSYGVVGDDNSDGRFQYISQWASGNSAYLVPSNYTGGKSPYTWYREASVGNPNLQWETAVKYNVGAEFSLFNGLLTGEVDYFAENRDNIVIAGEDRSVPDLFGQSAPDFNTGIVEVRGFEVVLAANYTFANDLNIFGNLNFTQAKDLVIAREDPLFSPEYQRNAGYAIGQSRSAIPAGILTSWDDVYMSTPKITNQGQTRVGYYDVVDFNGDGIYDSNFDNAPFGYPERPQRNWSATFGAKYKGWSVSAQLYGTQNASRRFSNSTFTQQTALIFTQDLNYWTVDTPNNIDTQPAWNAPGGTNPRDTWLDASLTRLKAVSVSYDVSSKFCKSIGLKQLRLFVNGNNLFLWSNLPDDREFNTSSDAQSKGDYPTLKRFNFGFNMNF